LKVTFLGTGTSQGVPVIGCSCEVCKSSDEHDKRLRSSVLIEVDNLSLVIDSGPDFRQQMLKAGVGKMNGVLITHEHKDHIAGLDDVRAFNWLQKKPMEVYAEKRVIKAIKREFEYVFEKDPYPGVPQIHLNRIDESPFEINTTQIIPIRGKHMHLPVLGFRINDFAYLTDFNFIDESELEKIKDLKVLVVNGLRKEPHISHFTLDESVAIIQRVKPEMGYITHISHQMGLSKDIHMPKGIELAYDMLAIEL
jgi:phosphoribosyl 1,2-cyclic phosphate phosphodiesterase